MARQDRTGSEVRKPTPDRLELSLHRKGALANSAFLCSRSLLAIWSCAGTMRVGATIVPFHRKSVNTSRSSRRSYFVSLSSFFPSVGIALPSWGNHVDRIDLPKDPNTGPMQTQAAPRTALDARNADRCRSAPAR